MNSILKEETGQVFLQVLKDAGVYSNTEEGRKQFCKFLHTVGMR